MIETIKIFHLCPRVLLCGQDGCRLAVLVPKLCWHVKHFSIGFSLFLYTYIKVFTLSTVFIYDI